MLGLSNFSSRRLKLIAVEPQGSPVITATPERVKPASYPGIWKVVVVSQYLSKNALNNIKFALAFFAWISPHALIKGAKAHLCKNALERSESTLSYAAYTEENPEKVRR
ncbi:hypothetical protein RND81_14G197300 [Saponaria officinalis]|uniref:Uncharacterized protein n=1 Tax=Saponaria officinalis TaxID=3572 RepID=A0AAW1GPA9_SAPOF